MDRRSNSKHIQRAEIQGSLKKVIMVLGRIVSKTEIFALTLVALGFKLGGSHGGVPVRQFQKFSNVGQNVGVGTGSP